MTLRLRLGYVVFAISCKIKFTPFSLILPRSYTKRSMTLAMKLLLLSYTSVLVYLPPLYHSQRPVEKSEDHWMQELQNSATIAH